MKTMTTLQEFHSKKSDLVDETTAKLLTTSTEYDHFDGNPADILHSGLIYVVRMIETCMELNDMSIIDWQIDWSINYLPHKGIDTNMLIDNLHVFKDVTDKSLSRQTANEVDAILDRMLELLNKRRER